MKKKRLLFKVLVEGRSCHGGIHAWPLPTKTARGWRASAWQSIDGAPILCERGMHLTDDPAAWWVDGCVVYVAEGRGKSVSAADVPHKIAYQEARLLRPATTAELEACQIYDSGAHVVRLGACMARGSSSVVAWGSSRVVARESSRVVARESSRVVAWESSSVEAWGSSSVVARESSRVVARESSSVVARESSRVVARGSSSVVAWGSSSVEAWGSSSVVARESSRVVARESSRVVAWESSSVEAWGSSSVVARESSSVEARGSSTTNVYGGTATGTECAVIIDRRINPPTVTVGGKGGEK